MAGGFAGGAGVGGVPVSGRSVSFGPHVCAVCGATVHYLDVASGWGYLQQCGVCQEDGRRRASVLAGGGGVVELQRDAAAAMQEVRHWRAHVRLVELRGDDQRRALYVLGCVERRAAEAYRVARDHFATLRRAVPERYRRGMVR